MRFYIAMTLTLLMPGVALAQGICPNGECLDEGRFECAKVTRSSFIQRICYDDLRNYLVVTIRGQDYGYCDISGEMMDAFEGAASMGRYFNQRIKDNECGPMDVEPEADGEDPASYLDGGDL